MSKKASSYDEAEGRGDDYEHPSVSREDRFPRDRVLRSRGFKIYSRPKRGEPLWERGGVIHKQSAAFRLGPPRLPPMEVGKSVEAGEEV